MKINRNNTNKNEYLSPSVLPALSAPKKLGEILVEIGATTPDKIEWALKKQEKIKKKKKLGEILIEEGVVDTHSIRHALMIQSFVTIVALMTSFFVSHISDTVTPAYGESRMKPLEVAVKVRPHWSIKVKYQVQSIQVSEADVKRGYVDVPHATGIAIRDTSRSGFLLLFEGLEKPFKSVSVQGLPGAGEIFITSKHALIHQPNKKTSIDLDLSYRFYLTEDAKPGEYSWPITVTLQPA
ncbi:MAG: hypothetical protein N2572_07985 [Syntrophales bacterium]|nr:hypothetical protein [Syntrophales bacterium]